MYIVVITELWDYDIHRTADHGVALRLALRAIDQGNPVNVTKNGVNVPLETLFELFVREG